MSPKRHINHLINECNKLNEHGHLLNNEEALDKHDSLQLAIYDLQAVLEKDKNYKGEDL